MYELVKVATNYKKQFPDYSAGILNMEDSE